MATLRIHKFKVERTASVFGSDDLLLVVRGVGGGTRQFQLNDGEEERFDPPWELTFSEQINVGVQDADGHVPRGSIAVRARDTGGNLLPGPINGGFEWHERRYTYYIYYSVEVPEPPPSASERAAPPQIQATEDSESPAGDGSEHPTPRRRREGLAHGTHVAGNCTTYAPTESDKLAVAMREYEPNIGSYTYLNWAAASAVGRRVSGKPSRPRRPVCRPPAQITAIVLHEMERWVYDVLPRDIGKGYHFVVHTNGMIVQRFDVVDNLSHCHGRIAQISIGIEFVTAQRIVGVAGQRTFQPPSGTLDRSPRTLIAAWGWQGYSRGKKYIVPPASQMDALYQLVNRLMTMNGADGSTLLRISSDWVGLKHSKAVRHPHLFLMHASESGRYLNRRMSGVYSHQQCTIKSRSDGAFQLFYTWLRHKKRLNGNEAYSVAKQYFSNTDLWAWIDPSGRLHESPRPGKRNGHLYFDVSDEALARARTAASE